MQAGYEQFLRSLYFPCLPSRVGKEQRRPVEVDTCLEIHETMPRRTQEGHQKKEVGGMLVARMRAGHMRRWVGQIQGSCTGRLEGTSGLRAGAGVVLARRLPLRAVSCPSESSGAS